VKATALAAGINLPATKKTLDELQELSPLATEVLLAVPQRSGATPGYVSGCSAIMRALSRAAPAARLLGNSAIDEARVDQWLDLVWNDIEVPCFLLKQQGAASDAAALAKSDLGAVLRRLDGHLAGTMFLAGARLTVADIALAVVVFDTMAATEGARAAFVGAVTTEATPHLRRYLALMGQQAGIKAVVPSAPDAFAPAAAGGVEAPDANAVAGLPPSRAGYVAADAKCETAFTPVAVPPGRFKRDRMRVKELLGAGAKAVGKAVVVKGWARTMRLAAKNSLAFIDLNDGSCASGVQVVCSKGETAGFEALKGAGGTGCSVAVTATVKESPKKNQNVELQASAVTVLGSVINPETYPMAKKGHSLEYLREQAHMRPRTRIYSSLARVRHAMAYATHKFFNDHGFLYVHTPLITSADCEGAGEQFAVTTLMSEEGKLADIPSDENGNIDFTKDFFSRRSSLTVSGQLNVETHCCALGDVYTFGPTFRAENSHTARHLAEFWMIEPEVAFCDLARDIDLAEDYLKYCVRYALEHCSDDLEFFENSPFGEKGLRARLANVIAAPFHRMTYTEAVELLQAHVAAGTKTFEEYPDWGIDLGSEHERYLAEVVYKKPVVLTDYPKGIKAFYMRLNDDGETVAAADVLAPKIGEVIGGSQREERLDVLERRCAEQGLPIEAVWWYLDLRKYGTIQHAGFGLGFERLLMLVTGLDNIRDTIPFPRYPGHSEF